ncbi:MAG: putative enoyl-CoA hydratase echA8 [Syntrophorhabdaceae bacterium PtaU1.Bin034]|nr:MAG: putative enoyl-CoA hydratase echA8 [Syntrophorhabdaceae bacterium PtaU1.Bin034]
MAVTFEKEGPLGIITINRPEVKNSLNLTVFRELDRVLDLIDEETRAIIVTGAGDSFVAGADINDLLSFDAIGGWAASRFQQSVFTKLERIGKPSIAAINGFALGGGLELALSCTFRVASLTAKLGFPELGLGIIPAFGGTERLVRTVGYAKAAELLLFRSLIDGQEAYRIGLVNHIAGQVMDKAKEMALSLCSLSPVAVRLELELLLGGESNAIDTGLSMEASLAALAVSSREAKELLGRFLGRGK